MGRRPSVNKKESHSARYDQAFASKFLKLFEILRMKKSNGLELLTELGYKTYIEQNKDKIDLSFFPNPAQNLLQIKLESQYKSQISSINIYSSNGKRVFSSANYVNNINLSKVAAGVYFIQINFGDDQVTQKLIIQ